MKDKLKFYINGAWVSSESNEKIEVINPANEELIGHVAAGTKDDINKAVLAAKEAFKTYQFTSFLISSNMIIDNLRQQFSLAS